MARFRTMLMGLGLTTALLAMAALMPRKTEVKEKTEAIKEAKYDTSSVDGKML